LLSLKPAISDSLRTVADIIRARSLPPDHYVPVGWTKCTACSFRAHCWAQANANRDIALLPEVEQELAIALRRSGVDCIETLLERFDAASLAALQYRSGSKSVRVGKRAESILSSARAFCTNEPVWMPNRPALLPSPTIAIIDFEGLPPLTVPHDYVYLWGMQLFGEDASKYQYSLAPANETDADRSAWFHFLTMCGALIEQNPSIQFVHYHHYEPTMVRKYIERYGDHNSVAARLLERCVDLHALLRESVCLPLASYSLKEVERYLGHSRSQTQCGGDWSIAAFIRAQESDDESLLHEICKYNAEDIAATWFVLQYLRENESRTATAIS
jgi:predicted RecB family nuclease